MDASNIINLGLLLVTAIATAASIIAVVDARRSRTSAGEGAQKAEAQANRASAAAEGIHAESTRIAQAIQAMNDRAEAQDARRLPWLVERVSRERWKVSNNTGAMAEMTEFNVRPPANVSIEDGLEFRDVAPGQPVFVNFGGGVTDPTTATLFVKWFDARRERHDAIITLG